MLLELVSFIAKAGKDCVIRAKDVMVNVDEGYRSGVPVLSLQGIIVAMTMAYYQSIGCPYKGYHELFFNRILYILYRVIGRNTAKLENNARLFRLFYFAIIVNDNWYLLNEITIKSEVCQEITFAKFGEDREGTLMRTMRRWTTYLEGLV